MLIVCVTITCVLAASQREKFENVQNASGMSVASGLGDEKKVAGGGLCVCVYT